jgi:hypothetical protein
LEEPRGIGQQPVDHCSTLRSLTRVAIRCTRSIRRFREDFSIMAVSGAWRSVYPRGHPPSRHPLRRGGRLLPDRPVAQLFHQRQLSTRLRDLHFVHPAGLEVQRSLRWRL